VNGQGEQLAGAGELIAVPGQHFVGRRADQFDQLGPQRAVDRLGPDVGLRVAGAGNCRSDAATGMSSDRFRKTQAPSTTRVLRWPSPSTSTQPA
jgi:hypothetical protein